MGLSRFLALPVCLLSWSTRHVLNHSPSTVHAQLDLQAAARLVDVEPTQEISQEFITSIYDLYSVETLRDRLGLRVGTQTPTDIFVFGKGEPDNPACTKVGGRPFWPRDREWPQNSGQSSVNPQKNQREAFQTRIHPSRKSFVCFEDFL